MLIGVHPVHPRAPTFSGVHPGHPCASMRIDVHTRAAVHTRAHRRFRAPAAPHGGGVPDAGVVTCIPKNRTPPEGGVLM